MRHVIIGNSAAGVTAAESLRKLQPKAEIIIISDELEHTYSRCLLPDFLSGERTAEQLRYRDNDFYKRNRIETILGQKVTSVETQDEQVVLADGRRIGYDRLLVATGASSFMPPIPGLKHVNAFGLRTLADAENIMAAAETARNVVIVGGGFVGLEAAYGLRRRGLDVTVVEMAPQILGLQLDEKAASILADDLQGEGVRLITGVGVTEIEKPSLWSRLRRAPRRVVLANGEKLNADLVILAIGTRTNVEPVKDTTIQLNRGILVDNYLETNVSGVFSAGDVAETRDVVTDNIGLSPIWPNAVVQGRYAAHNMAGQKKSLAGMVSMRNAVEFREVPAIAIGLSKATEADGYEIITVERPHQQTYKKLVLKDNRLYGMILVGDIQQAGVLGDLIRNKTDITDVKDKLLKPGFSHAEILQGCA
ncbi:NAD(P)/FAD-dependent oxidoreductase [Dethiobacter alkaliphilus]|uniref:NAD(P)/FAD-dependent oxidoreductase n=1 Tax=Dethiobacter alkaliphilus TaxID=427926 RepID=UPI002225E536|nr:FAD-dependent oxidoreductase [Dethiobacter alkaliphilus]MCW3489250.1 FAD-dependent oxidoreductase [Dethiobacter alkaliphilus]